MIPAIIFASITGGLAVGTITAVLISQHKIRRRLSRSREKSYLKGIVTKDAQDEKAMYRNFKGFLKNKIRNLRFKNPRIAGKWYYENKFKKGLKTKKVRKYKRKADLYGALVDLYDLKSKNNNRSDRAIKKINKYTRKMEKFESKLGRGYQKPKFDFDYKKYLNIGSYETKINVGSTHFSCCNDKNFIKNFSSFCEEHFDEKYTRKTPVVYEMSYIEDENKNDVSHMFYHSSSLYKEIAEYGMALDLIHAKSIYDSTKDASEKANLRFLNLKTNNNEHSRISNQTIDIANLTEEMVQDISKNSIELSDELIKSLTGKNKTEFFAGQELIK